MYTPSTTSSSGSVCETDPSSLSSSYKSNNGTASNINDETNTIAQNESSLTLTSIIDKLKRELSAAKQAKGQLAALYKVS